MTRAGRENLEDWKLVLRGLIERGLRRVMLVIHDDFSGLLPITASPFPNADTQLASFTCCAMQRRIFRRSM